MKTLARLVLVALLTQATAFALPAAAQAQDNTAIAVNKKDGKSVFKLAFSVKKASGDVDASNTAAAYASCTDCKTVAAAIQVVLVSDAGSATLENVSVAINYQCTECETLAAAYQFVFADGQEIEFTKEGKQRLHDLKKRFHDLKQRDDLTLDQLADEIAAIAPRSSRSSTPRWCSRRRRSGIGRRLDDDDRRRIALVNGRDAPHQHRAPTTTSANPATSPSTTAAPTTSPPTTAGTSDTSPPTTAAP